MSNSSPYIVAKIPKLPAKYLAIVMPFFLSFLMSGLISLVNMVKNVGWVEHFAPMWLSAWFFSWLVAFPTVLFLLPLVRRISLLFVDVSLVK
mgnify:CR=1 FL=1